MARSIKAIAENLDVPLIFKASYDKANRTSVTSFRGPGVREGCRILSEIGRELKLPVVTDVHTAQEAEIAAEYVDLLQVPAFLCRQTDLLEACAKSGRPVNIKKGQFLAPWDTVNIGEKMRAFGCDEFMMCERGTSFGYNNLVVDMRRDIGFGYTTVGVITGGAQIGFLLFSSVTSYISRFFEGWKISLVSTVMTSLALLGLSVSDNITAIVIYRDFFV